MIVVIVIIGIGCSIAVPNFATLIQRNQLKGYVHTAQNAENALLALTGLQYANSDTGNPKGIGANPDKWYVSIDTAPGSIVPGVFQITVADGADSEGRKEFYKRTMNNLIPPPLADDRPVVSAYFYSTGLPSGSNTFVHYEGHFAYSAYFMADGGRTLAIFHNARPDTSAIEAGWHIFEYKGGSTYVHIGSV